MDILALIIMVFLIIYLMLVGFPRSVRHLSARRTFLRFYLYRTLSSWFLLGIISIILLHDGVPLASIGLRLPDPWWPTLLAFIGVGILFSLLLMTYLRLISDEQVRAKLSMQKSRLALPRTRSERLAWVGVSINTGIWEEIVFRGFLPWYVVHHVTFFGFPIPFIWAVIFSLILFSVAHLYQGWGGVLRVGLFGISEVVLYALTGNLLASILWHLLFNVRFAFGKRTLEGTARQSASAAEAHPNRVEKPAQSKWMSWHQRRLRQPKGQQEQIHERENEENTALDVLEREPDTAGSVSSDALQVGPESKEAAKTGSSTNVSKRPVRGRAAREQLLRDMGGEL